MTIISSSNLWYVDRFEGEVISLFQVVQELNEVKAEIEQSTANLYQMMKELKRMTSEAQEELDNF